MRKRRGLTMDLTPLLDVILIILFLVLMVQKIETTKAIDKNKQQADRQKQAEVAVLAEKIEKLQQENQKLSEDLTQSEKTKQRILEDQGLTQEKLALVDVLEEESNQLRITIPSNYPRQPLAVKDMATGEIKTYEDLYKMTEAIKEKLQQGGNKMAVIILSFDSRHILFKDYQRVNQAILQLRAEAKQNILYREQDQAN